ncbi:SGNH/GDSL hydrolase family protein [Trichocoleus desertorum AS-A10]|uniref:SGNH/GDSL hydrolase family protein n=1 Tax=Trichocoleus desertorum TaxID=1481672 RepID=UPI003297FBAC
MGGSGIVQPAQTGLVGYFDVPNSSRTVSPVTGKVPQWNTLAGSSNAVQATVADQPKNLGDAFFSEGLNSGWSISVPIDRRSFSIFLVVKATAPGVQQILLTTGSIAFQTQFNGGKFQLYDGAAFVDSGLTVSSGYQLYGVSSSATSLDFYVGNLSASRSALSAGSHTLTNMFNSGADFSFRGYVKAVLIYNRPVAIAEVKAYLDAKVAQSNPAYSLPTLKRVLFDGNSLVRGFRATNADTNFPGQCLSSLGSEWHGFNFGVDGQITPNMTADAAVQVDSLKRAELTKDVVVAWEATNDLFFGASAATAFSNLKAYCQARKAAGFKVVVLTVLPRSSAGTPAGYEAARQALNSSLRADFNVASGSTNVLLPAPGIAYADALADVAADTRIGDAGDEANATYYFADLVHLNNTGYGIVAAIAKDAVLAV